MKGVLIIIVLFFLLVRGDDYVYMGTHHHPICYLASRNIEKDNQPQKSAADQEPSAFRTKGTAEQDTYFVCEKVEDEGSGNLFGKRFKEFVRYIPLNTLTGLSLNYLQDCLKDGISLSGYLPGKYIIQRVLRI